MKLLLIANFPRIRELGAARIHIELGEEWRLQGHEVEEFFWNDAFPRSCSKWLAPFLQTQVDFARAAHRFVRQRGGAFDVIDSCEGALFQDARALGTSSLLVVRSAGLTGLYAKILGKRFIQPKTLGLRTAMGNVLRAITRLREGEIRRKSFAVADVANLVNDEEEQFLRNDWQNSVPVIKFPYGMSSARLAAFRAAAAPAADRLPQAQVAFVGAWQPRKGSGDFPKILRRVREQVTHARFLFLGTGVSSGAIHGELGGCFRECLEVVPAYESARLPGLLGPCTIGMFPSYVESFGFAVLEMLASGLPTVAYRSPGPPVMLQHCEPSCLVSAGNWEGLADQIVRRLQYPVADYEAESRRSMEVAARFAWPTIATQTIDRYANILDDRKRAKSRGGRQRVKLEC